MKTTNNAAALHPEFRFCHMAGRRDASQARSDFLAALFVGFYRSIRMARLPW
jgi:hypothetical protein